MSRVSVTVSEIFACRTSMSFFCNSDKAYNLGWGGVVYLALPAADPDRCRRCLWTIIAEKGAWRECRAEHWAQLEEGRHNCLACLDSVVVDTQDAHPLYAKVAYPQHTLKKMLQSACLPLPR